MTDRESRVAIDSAALGVGSVVAGGLAYAFVLLGSRTLGGDAFAPVALLWTYWLVVTAVIALPLQQWLIRSYKAGVGTAAIRHTTRRAMVVCAAWSVVVTLAFAAARRQLFDSGSLVYPACIGLITIGSFMVGVARGYQGSRDRYVWVGASLAGENAIRVAGALVGALIGAGAPFFAALLPLGFAVAVIPPSALRAPAARVGRSVSSRPETMVLLSTAGAALLQQLVWGFGPFAASAMGAAPATVTGIFLLLALARVPNIIATAVGLRVLAWMTHLSGDEDGDGLDRFRGRITSGTLLLVPVALLLGAVLGPPIVRALFGGDVDTTSVEAALIATGGLVGVAVLFLTLSLVAVAEAPRAITAGVVALGAIGLCLLTGVGRPSTTVAMAFAVGFLTYLVTITALARRR